MRLLRSLCLGRNVTCSLGAGTVTKTVGTDARDRFKNDAPFGMESRVHMVLIMARYPVGREPVALREGRMVVLEGNEEGVQKWLLEYMSRRLGGGGAPKKIKLFCWHVACGRRDPYLL